MNIRLLLSSFILCIGLFAQPEDALDKCIASVEKYVHEKLASTGTYLGYNYREFEVHKPKEFQQLEELIRVKKELPKFKGEYSRYQLDSLINATEDSIQAKKRYIIDNKLKYSYELQHTLSIAFDKNNIKAFRIKFYLNHAYKVMDIESVFILPLSKDQTDAFYYFQTRIPIYRSIYMEEAEESSEQLYDFYESALRATDYDKKVLDAGLLSIKLVKEDNTIDPDKLGRIQIEKWVEENGTHLKNYKSLDHSYMYEIRGKENKYQIIGYKMFHKYSYENEEGNKVIDVVYFEFDPYFVIRGALAVPDPAEDLFKKE